MAFLGSNLLSRASPKLIFSGNAFFRARSSKLRNSLLGAMKIRAETEKLSEQDAAMGEFQEELRLRCADILISLQNYNSVFDDVRDAFGTVGTLAEQLKETVQALREKQARNVFLEESERKLRDSLAELEHEKESLARQCAKLESANEHANSDCQKLKQSLESLTSNFWEQNAQLNSLTSEQEFVKKRLATVTRDLDATQVRLDETLLQREALSSQVNDLKDLIAIEKDGLRQEMEIRAGLENSLVGANKKIDELDRAESQAVKQRNDLQKEVDELASENHNLRNSLSETSTLMMTSNVDYEAKIVLLNGRIEKYNNLLSDARDELKKAKELKSEHTSLLETNQTITAELETTRAALEDSKNRNQKLQKELFQLSQNCTDFQTKIGHQETEVERFLRENDELRQNLTSANQAMEEQAGLKNKEIEVLTQKLANAESLRQQSEGALEVAHQDREKLQRTIAALREFAPRRKRTARSANETTQTSPESAPRNSGTTKAAG